MLTKLLSFQIFFRPSVEDNIVLVDNMMTAFPRFFQNVLLVSLFWSSTLAQNTSISSPITTVTMDAISLGVYTSTPKANVTDMGSSTPVITFGTSQGSATLSVTGNATVLESNGPNNSEATSNVSASWTQNQATYSGSLDTQSATSVTTTSSNNATTTNPKSAFENNITTSRDFSSATTANISLTTYGNTSTVTQNVSLTTANVSLTTKDNSSLTTPQDISSANTIFISTNTTTRSTTLNATYTPGNTTVQSSTIVQTTVNSMITSVTDYSSSYSAGDRDKGNVNKAGVVLGAIIGSILGIALIVLIGYILCGFKKNEQFTHRRLYESSPNDPVLRLDNPSHTLDLNYGGANYYNPAAPNDSENIKAGNPPDSIQMSDINRPSSGQPV